MVSYIIFYRRINDNIRSCIERSYGTITAEFPFIKALAVSVDEDRIKNLVPIAHIVSISQDMMVRKLDAHNTGNSSFSFKDTDGGRGVTIAIPDTGIHPHYDLIRPSMRINHFKDYINGREKPYDDDGHGTHVAGIAAGNGYTGNAPSGPASLSDISAFKVLDSEGCGNTSHILKAMEWIYENKDEYNIRVCNLSFGMKPKEGADPLLAGVKALYKRGITVVCAAGNSGPGKGTVSSPGISPYVITAGSCNNRAVSSFSSRGPSPYGDMKPDLVAFGEDICSLGLSKDGTDIQSGTSMAAPYISGLAACLYSRYPELTPFQVKHILVNSAVPFSSEPPESQGAGRI